MGDLNKKIKIHKIMCLIIVLVSITIIICLGLYIKSRIIPDSVVEKTELIDSPINQQSNPA